MNHNALIGKQQIRWLSSNNKNNNNEQEDGQQNAFLSVESSQELLWI